MSLQEEMIGCLRIVVLVVIPNMSQWPGFYKTTRFCENGCKGLRCQVPKAKIDEKNSLTIQTSLQIVKQFLFISLGSLRLTPDVFATTVKEPESQSIDSREERQPRQQSSDIPSFPLGATLCNLWVEVVRWRTAYGALTRISVTEVSRRCLIELATAARVRVR